MENNTQQQPIPTANEFLGQKLDFAKELVFGNLDLDRVEQLMIEFAQIHCKAQRTTIVKEVRTHINLSKSWYPDNEINNAYPDNLIK